MVQANPAPATPLPARLALLVNKFQRKKSEVQTKDLVAYAESVNIKVNAKASREEILTVLVESTRRQQDEGRKRLQELQDTFKTKPSQVSKQKILDYAAQYAKNLKLTGTTRAELLEQLAAGTQLDDPKKKTLQGAGPIPKSATGDTKAGAEEEGEDDDELTEARIVSALEANPGLKRRIADRFPNGSTPGKNKKRSIDVDGSDGGEDGGGDDSDDDGARRRTAASLKRNRREGTLVMIPSEDYLHTTIAEATANPRGPSVRSIVGNFSRLCGASVREALASGRSRAVVMSFFRRDRMLPALLGHYVSPAALEHLWAWLEKLTGDDQMTLRTSGGSLSSQVEPESGEVVVKDVLLRNVIKGLDPEGLDNPTHVSHRSLRRAWVAWTQLTVEVVYHCDFPLGHNVDLKVLRTFASVPEELHNSLLLPLNLFTKNESAPPAQAAQGTQAPRPTHRPKSTQKRRPAPKHDGHARLTCRQCHQKGHIQANCPNGSK